MVKTQNPRPTHLSSAIKKRGNIPQVTGFIHAKILLKMDILGKIDPLCEVATWEYTRVKENPHRNEHFKPWMECAF
jgi:hypothetical protein